MFLDVVKRAFGTANDRYLRRLRSKVDAINALEPEIEALDDAALRARTDMLRDKLADGATLDDILVDAFATVREAAKRTLGQRHFDVQLLGGMVLHGGMIAEMKTGEGKTLMATLAGLSQCAARQGRSHRHGERLSGPRAMPQWMGQIYEFLGMTVRRCIVPGLSGEVERRQAYMPPTSPTAPTTNSVSTICATI